MFRKERKMSPEVGGEPMTDEEIEILGTALADVEAALDKVDPKLAERIRAEQHDVAETMRRAQNNPELLRLRVLGRMGAGDLTNLL